MVVRVKRGYGEMLINVLRQVALMKLPVWRPIAFSIVGRSNVLDAGSDVIEDMVTVGSALASACYHVESDKDIFVAEYQVGKVFSLSDLEKGPVHVMVGQDKEFIHCFTPVTFRVFFRRACGGVTREQNVGFLESAGYLGADVVVVNSRHSDVFSFSFHKIDSVDFDEYEVSIDCRVYNESRILALAKEELISVLTELEVA